jgi:hypothetical protein
MGLRLRETMAYIFETFRTRIKTQAASHGSRTDTRANVAKAVWQAQRARADVEQYIGTYTYFCYIALSNSFVEYNFST